MSSQLSPGISIEEETPQVRTIQGVPSLILAAIGITERGPFVPKLITSFESYRRLFGGHTINGYLSRAIQGFFDNGGKAAYVKRVVHYGDPADGEDWTSAFAELTIAGGVLPPQPAQFTSPLKAPYNLETASGWALTADGTSSDIETMSADAASLSMPGNGGTRALADGQTLLVTVNGTPQTVTFAANQFVDIAAATLPEIAAVLNASLTGVLAEVFGNLFLRTTRRGTASSLQVTGGTANGVLAFETTAETGSGDVADLASVTLAELTAYLEDTFDVEVTSVGGKARIATTTTGVGSTLVFDSTGEAGIAAIVALGGVIGTTYTGSDGGPADAFYLRGKTDGSYANALSVRIAPPTSSRQGEFNLVVEQDGLILERWPNLSMNPLARNFHELVLNNEGAGSWLIASEDRGTGVVPAAGLYGPLTGGDDGLVGLTDLDFVGAPGARTGMHGFDVSDDVRLLICPDRETPIVHVSLVDYCSRVKKGAIFPICSPPEGLDVEAARTYVEDDAGLYNLSEFGAMYYPNGRILNPNTALFGSSKTLWQPNSGHIAGVFARTAQARAGGIYDAPAGAERGQIVGFVALENDFTQEEENRDLLYPANINPLRMFGSVCVIDGVRTFKIDGNFPTVSERLAVTYIEQAICKGTEFVKFRNHDAALRAEIERTITSFLIAQMNLGAFRSRRANEAFFVDVGEDLNPPTLVFRGQLVGRVGLATQKPAEFIVFKFSQDSRALEAELAAS